LTQTVKSLKEDAKLIATTQSICPTCNAIIPAELVEVDGKVLMRKSCPEHGYVEELYFGDADMYRKFSKWAHDGKGIENPNVQVKEPTCPMDCGLCSMHLSHTALANIVVTNRCDLRCWYCFFYSEKAGYVYEPTLEQIEEMIKILRAERPVPGNSVQLTGGEPCLRDDLPEIVRIIKKYGVDHVQLNTNGIRLANDFEFFRKVKEAGLSTLYLSFDGVTPETNIKNHWEIPAILDNARKLNVGVVLVPTIIKSVNDHELGDIIRFGFKNIDIVRSVNFQPVSLTGLMPKKDRDKYRITIPDCIHLIEEQTDGQIPVDAWFTVPTCTPVTHFVEALTLKPQYELTPHFVCGAGTYVFKDGDRLVPITEFVDIEGLLSYISEKAEEIRQGKSKYIVGLKLLMKIKSFVNESKMPSGLNLSRILFQIFVKHDYSTLGEWHKRSLFLGMMHFQDKYNYDIERVKRCSIHYLVPDGRIIPFCAFNVLPEIYRDAIQAKYGIPIPEWERRTGRKLSQDFYVRKQASVVEGSTQA